MNVKAEEAIGKLSFN